MQDDTTDWYGPEAATFGDRLAAARDQAGMTQTDLAKRLGVKLSTLKKWEDDLLEPRANRLSIMAGVLNVSLVWLLTGEGDGVSAPNDDSAELPSDVNALLLQMRDIHTQMKQLSDRLSLLEKHLRKTLQDDTK